MSRLEITGGRLADDIFCLVLVVFSFSVFVLSCFGCVDLAFILGVI